MMGRSSGFYQWRLIPIPSHRRLRSKEKKSLALPIYRHPRRMRGEIETTLEASRLTGTCCGKRGQARRGMPQPSASQTGQAIQLSQAHTSGIKRRGGHRRSERRLGITHLLRGLRLHRRCWAVFQKPAIAPYRSNCNLAPAHPVKAKASSYKRSQSRRKKDRAAALKQRGGRLRMSLRLEQIQPCLNPPG